MNKVHISWLDDNNPGYIDSALQNLNEYRTWELGNVPSSYDLPFHNMI